MQANLMLPLSSWYTVLVFYLNPLGQTVLADGECYRANVCPLPPVPLQFTCWSLHSQHDGIRWRGLWEILDLDEVMRVVEPSWVKLVLSQNETWERWPLSLSFYHMKIQQKSIHLQTRKRALTRNHASQHLDPGLLSLQNCEKHLLLLKPPSQWYIFVVVAQTSWLRQGGDTL